MIAVLCGLVWGAPAHAISIVETTSTVAYFDGDVIVNQISQSKRLPLGGNLMTLSNEVTDPNSLNSADPATATAISTHDLSALKIYANQVDDSTAGGLGFIGGINWWTKESAFLKISATDGHRSQNNTLSIATRNRGSETHAILAVAPNSASGFADDTVSASTGGGNGIRLLMYAFFQGGNFTDHLFSDPTTPGFVFGDGFSDSGAPGVNNVGPTFGETLMAFNTGHSIVVDLAAAGVAVGDEYSFWQSYILGVGPGVWLTGNQVAFVDIDPIIGFATVPEPGTITLLALAIGSMTLARKKKKRTYS